MGKKQGMSTALVPKEGFQWQKVQDMINNRPILAASHKFAKQYSNSDLSKKEWDQLDKNNLLECSKISV
ncbi:hypothetical protein [Rickettsia prowazekii]|uniref:Uncharacterized protein n=2 Tax=Rickettsia prowazekii TaxID=782 RepID=D5AXX6_RICPP|nr:hypothetical protein [Rickettsia prowazekii]ADE30265.1 hypothetical protein rpr22_0753 [Rickettsia prowazekii str. Rp22]AFE49506.1 hypothetical protein M9W_03415 [Rickettsia prowazekii str. Chernikova]AFE50350.1 hypothetical protein M9Y_03420 [Rickettsia prowazekii str. Katsinyian]AFE51196.1 hypothetical protein MA1_03410 [Rickettsia prowazekii str. BuV67-CWPP]AFE52031.1 hypothetical protein MA3_03450 [Rickettsia prowazekii str. Dachau]AFE53700.1 hypothetical protein MA7_03410 [Rickettsia 